MGLPTYIWCVWMYSCYIYVTLTSYTWYIHGINKFYVVLIHMVGIYIVKHFWFCSIPLFIMIYLRYNLFHQWYRPGFGCNTVYKKLSCIQYYRVSNIINLKLCTVLYCFIMFIILNYILLYFKFLKRYH